MTRRYIFTHRCGHVGTGPIIPPPSERHHGSYHLGLLSHPEISTIDLNLPIDCPFCDHNGLVREVVEDGWGVLAKLVHSRRNPNSTVKWKILRKCDLYGVDQDPHLIGEDIDEFQNMAWIPKPCGEVHVQNRQEAGISGRRLGTVVEVESSWTQSLGAPVMSRLPGMMSELSSVMKSREERDERMDFGH